ncbi:helix-turn-helix domain-containing protein [Lysobacter sp. CA199]|uniref:helix-turn-helix domain-containing protein n=1 Tax=Lysobacter sp. CA199 TaxID=3455608 RepID=UPI003F8D4E51
MKSHQPTIGGLLRSLRARNQWTLKQMSEHAGIPLSTLSKIEHDRLSLTYDKLLQLSQRLNLSMSELFAETHAPATRPVTARRSIGRMRDAARVTDKNYDAFFLCTELRRKRMTPSVIQIRARSLKEFGPLVRSQGEEFVFVLEGVVELHTEFYDVAVLQTGEGSYIDANMSHAYVLGRNCESARVLAVSASDDAGLLATLMAHQEEA